MTKDHHGSKGCVNVNQSASLEQCDNVTVNPPLVDAGPTIVQLPITLAEIRVTSNLVANIHFPDPVLEIKDIKKRVKIVQCRLLLGGNTVDVATGLLTRPVPLFIKGFIRKNIQYATPCPHAKSDCVSSEMRSLTVDVPFECVTNILPDQFFTNPIIPDFNTRNEFDFFRAQKLGHGFPEKDELLSSDLSQFHQVSEQFYNQLPYCELISSRIVQWDESIDRYPLPGNGPFEEGTFETIVEKSMLDFTIKVLQKQQVRIQAL
jgi:hypothetical protein